MKEKIESALPYIFIGALITIVALGVWLYVTKGNVSVLEYRIAELKEELKISTAAVEKATKEAEIAHKKRIEQFEESEQVIAELQKEIQEREIRIRKEILRQNEIRAELEELRSQPEPDYSNTDNAELAIELTNNLREDHPEKDLDPVEILNAASFFFTREVAEAMNTTLINKEALEQQLALTGDWMASKETQTENMKKIMDDQNEIIDEKNEEIQSLFADYSAKSSQAAILQSENMLLKELNSGQGGLINQMKRRQWMERGIGTGAIAAIIIALVASR